MDQSIERWRPVVGLEDRYEVSDHGRVRSLSRIILRNGEIPHRHTGRIMNQQLRAGTHASAKDYWRIKLQIPGGFRQFAVHRLVADAFCEKPEGCTVVNHIDNNPLNNYCTNLEWTTYAENTRYSWVQGRGRIPRSTGPSHPASKYTQKQALAVIDLIKQKMPYREIAKTLNVSHSFVADVGCGRHWTCLQH